MLKNHSRMIAQGKLFYGIMHGLVFFVLELQGHDRQAVQEQDKVNFLVGLAKIEMRPEGDPVFAVFD